MRVTIAYALAQDAWVREVELASGTRVSEAIERSGLLAQFPELTDTPLDLGIFSRRCSADAVLEDGDRVEIYRPLQIDPMQARRARAALRRKK